MPEAPNTMVLDSNNMKKNKTFFILLIAAAIGTAFFFGTRKSNLPAPTQTEDQISNWKTYTNNFYHLEFKYPQNYSFNENSDKIEINAPLSICNPALIFNTEEYKQLREVQIIIKKRHGSLEKILTDEGGKNYGWESKSFNEKPGYWIAVGAEMITPYTRFLVESYPGEVLDIQAFIFASGDQGKCIPKLDIASASTISSQILSTFKFLDSSNTTIGNTDNKSLNYISAMSILQNVPEIQELQKDIIKLGRTTFFEAGEENGDVVKIWLYEDGNPDKHITRIDTFNVNVKTKVVTVDDVAMMSGKEFITLEEWKKTVTGRFQ